MRLSMDRDNNERAEKQAHGDNIFFCKEIETARLNHNQPLSYRLFNNQQAFNRLYVIFQFGIGFQLFLLSPWTKSKPACLQFYNLYG
jgi:hypothetical protein